MKKMFPAYAGMILSERDFNCRISNVPSIRGDDSEHHCTGINELQCSPHTRG